MQRGPGYRSGVGPEGGQVVKNMATVSDDGLYRYVLSREWSEGGFCCWVLLNPSTADAEKDDPTIRRVVGFSKSLGYGGAVVVNLFALRVTRPVHLLDHPDPIGPENDDRAGFWIRHLPVIVGFGAHKLVESRMEWLDRELWMNGGPVRCFGETKDGWPRHPLYLPKTATASEWRAS